MLDTELLADVYIELMGGAQSGLAFETVNKNSNEVEKISSAALSDGHLKKIIPSRGFAISEIELSIHQQFIQKNFKSNFWGYVKPDSK